MSSEAGTSEFFIKKRQVVHSQGSWTHKSDPHQAVTQTGTIYVIDDENGTQDDGSHILQVLSDGVIILNVHASVTDVEQDTPGKMAVLSIRPLMVGKLAKTKSTGSQEDAGEAMLRPVNATPVCFQVLLDGNGRLRESISEVENRLHEELVRQDEGSTEIIKQWNASMPETSENLAQGLLYVLPEILVAKSFCSMEDIVPSSERESADSGVHIPVPSSVSPTLSVEEASATNKKSEEHSTKAGRVGQDVMNEDNFATPEDIIASTDMAKHEHNHQLASFIIEDHIIASVLSKFLESSPIDAAGQTDDQSKGIADTHETETTSKSSANNCYPNQASVQTGAVYLLDDDENTVHIESNILQVLSNAAIILDVHASLTDAEQDTLGKTAVISIRPLMAGQLTQNRCTGSEEAVGASVLQPVNTRPVCFQVLLDANGRLQEPMSEVEKRLHTELLRQDQGSREIMQQWNASMPDINETSESLIQGLLYVLPDILVAKGLCSMADIIPTDDAVQSCERESADNFVRLPLTSSSIVSSEDTTRQRKDGATNTKSEEHSTKTGRVVQDENNSATLENIASTGIVTHEDKHRFVYFIIEDDVVASVLGRHLESGPIDATDQTDDQSKGIGDTHEIETTSERDAERYVDEEGDEFYDALDYVYTSDKL